MILAIVMGILPGLLLWGLVWLVISGGVDQLKREIGQALVGRDADGRGDGWPDGSPQCLRAMVLAEPRSRVRSAPVAASHEPEPGAPVGLREGHAAHGEPCLQGL